jgi:transposase
VKHKRQERAAAMPGLDADRLVFLDETWAVTHMTRRYGRAPAGQRLVEAVPFGHRKTTTSLAGPRTSGLTAPSVVDGAITGEPLEARVRRHLIPTLRAGDIVITGDLLRHKRAGVQEALAQAGRRAAYLPPYSPDYNPIEPVFAKLKALLRTNPERAVAGLWDRLGRHLDDFSAAECRNYFRHCGYAATHSTSS